MRQGSMTGPGPGSDARGDRADEESAPARRPGDRAAGEVAGRRWLSEPKTAVWIALAAAVLIGGGRKLSAWWQARKAVARLGEPDVTPDEIEAVAEHGRAGVYELLRIFSSSPVGTAAAGRRAARWRDSGSSTSSSPRKRRPSFGAVTP